MSERICPVCANVCYERLKKENTPYYECINCKMLYSDPIDQDNMVGGGNEIPRNQLQNHLRIERLDGLFKGKDKSKINVLDFGCGTGYLVKDLNAAGYVATGFDPFNPEFSRLPPKDSFEATTCVECLEHWAYPYAEIEVIHRSLKKHGIVYFESSFVDVAAQENIELEDFEYIEPKVGHSSIFSFHAIDLLMLSRGFLVGRHWNRHTKLYYKA